MNFLGMGPMELMLILVLALIVFGPGKLPEIAGQVGKAVRDFRRATTELSSEFNRTLSLEVEERKAAQPAAASADAPAATTAAPAPPVATVAAAAPAPAPVAATTAPAPATTGDGAAWAFESSGSAETRPEPTRRTLDPKLAPPF
jgi:TatA/E family protein of Tat protein translocase